MNELAMARRVKTAFFTKALGKRILNFVIRKEGGQMTSCTLRRVLREQFDIEVGPFSYGSLLELGMSDGKVTIGPYVSIGKNVRRYGASHPLSKASLHPYFYNPALGIASTSEDVTRLELQIGPDVWIGSNVTILPGCSKIGIGAVIGAGTVVTKDIGPFEIVVGNPGRTMKQRFPSETQRRIMASEYWKHEPQQAKEILDSVAI